MGARLPHTPCRAPVTGGGGGAGCPLGGTTPHMYVQADWTRSRMGLHCSRHILKWADHKTGPTALVIAAFSKLFGVNHWGLAFGIPKCKTEIQNFFFRSDVGKLAKPSYQTALDTVLGIRNQSRGGRPFNWGGGVDRAPWLDAPPPPPKGPN